uniref:Glycosyl transferase family 2 n=1 Tax=Candidatus Kentrum sp. SD TaxID=2126332 RepID=A0A450YN88_9GAMM|nr:MAG: Glycosyl transferase family 2 [Candidatus Kentron sp. SD]VFK42966.1 MAG: Glycosyl transferase family 2 [Candidatus Kentron sp. SD]
MILSIIIPTRERATYLRESIQTALQIPDRNIEIVISDNASTDGTKQLVSKISDPRIKYVNTGRRVSMRQNFEFGMRNSSGDYVIFFGDDDGILPRQFKFLRQILEKERPDGLRWNVPRFAWPMPNCSVGEYLEYRPGSLPIEKKKLFSGLDRIDCEAYGKYLLACSLKGFRQLPPTIYHGCVSRDYFNQIAAPDGTYFNSNVPDAYFWCRSVLAGGNFIHVDHVFSLEGAGPVSTGRAYIRLARDATDSVQNEPSHRYIEESRQDRLKDVVPCPPFFHSLLLFSTLETVRARFPGEDQIPDYLAWYHHMLSEDSPWQDTVRKILRDYAVKSRTVSALEQTESEQRDHPVSGSRYFKRALSSVREFLRNHDYITRSVLRPRPKRFRLSAEINGESTILSAVNVYDALLSDDYKYILDGTSSREAIWRRVIERSRAYPLWRGRNSQTSEYP